MSGFYPKLPVISKALRNLLIRSYSKSAQKPSPAVTKSVTKKSAKGKRDAGGASGGSGCSKSAGGSGSRGGDGCSTKSSVKTKYFIDHCDMFHMHKGHSKPFRLLSYCMLPILIAFAFNVFSHHEEHEHHFVPYDYMYIRTKKYFWGDHQKSFFHGPNNFLRDEELPKFKKLPDAEAEDLKRRKDLRDLHAKEELERRKRRREQEALK